MKTKLMPVIFRSPFIAVLSVAFSVALNILCAVAPQMSFADTFEFKHAVGDKYRFLSTTKQELFLNGKLIQVSNLVDRMASEVVSINSGVARHRATFDVAEELSAGDGAAAPAGAAASGAAAAAGAGAKRLRWGNETYSSEFGRSSRGEISIDKKYFMPSARNVPLFPAEDIKAGFTWKNNGTEVLDLRDTFDIKTPYEIPFNANNTFLGEKEYKGRTYKTFKIDYNLSRRQTQALADGFENDPKNYMYRKDNTPAAAAANNARGQNPNEQLVSVSGKSSQIIYWDEKLGQIAAASDEYELRFELSSGEIFVFKGKTDVEMLRAEEFDKKQAEHDIEEELKKLGVEGATVKIVNDGISISLDNIQFDADSDELRASEKAKLDKISTILRKYNDRDILVSGHSAEAGDPALSLPLSEKRAVRVADYFILEDVRPQGRIITRGYGSSQPVASNATEEGRAKNRRVEITILEN
jgi:outer membrane protein OmpA-like peptidoglycan-associated protein